MAGWLLGIPAIVFQQIKYIFALASEKLIAIISKIDRYVQKFLWLPTG